MSSGRKRRGFTLLEVMVAVAVMGLVATGALKLSVSATKNLNVLRAESLLLERVRILETRLLTGNCPENGEEDGLKWQIMPFSYPLMDGLWRVDYRQLDVTLGDRTLTLYIP